MSKAHNPRRGSMQFWPRKRSRHSLVRVRSWAPENQAKLLGFIGYKVGMTHVLVTDNHPKSLTKGENISLPVSIVECPPVSVCGVAFYKKSMFGTKKVASVFAEKFNKHLSKSLTLPKKTSKKIDDVTEFDSLRLLVHSNPSKTGIGAKRPKLLEMAVGGSKDDQLAFAKEFLGKDVIVKDVFGPGNQVDLHGVTKGKGFQGTTKRYGTPLKHHKSEKGQRGIGNLGAWTPKRVDYRVAQPGKMGNHLRTEYNKQIVKFSENPAEINPKGGKHHYGDIKNPYLLIKGSIVGSANKPIVLTKSIRSNKKFTKDAAEVTYVALKV